MSRAETLVELLADHGIRLRSMVGGHTEHIRCPKCDGGRTKEPSFAVTVDEDGRGFVAICHRGSCGQTEGARLIDRERVSTPVPREYQEPAPARPGVETNQPDWLFEVFAARKIGARVLKELGIYAVERSFPPSLARSPCIVFPYRWRGRLVNRKIRSHPDKRMMQEKDALPTLYNVDALGETPGEIVWVEGEMDVAALLECGVTNAISLKDGAPASVKAETDPNAKRFEALRTHADMLAVARRIVLAGDMDPPGLALREELARRLGRHRCHTVTWPEGCKDAGDVLSTLGPEAVLVALREAQPYPIDGLQKPTTESLLALRARPAPAVMTTGTVATDAILHLPTEGRLIVVTGYPGHGKTNWTRFVMMHTAHAHDRRWAVFSPEMQPWEQFAAECAEVRTGKPFYPVRGIDCLTDAEIAEVGEWLRDRITMLVHDAEDEAPSLEWVIDHGRMACIRDGVTDLLIDPWNEIDQTRPPGMSETDHIGRSLQRLKAFALRHGCNVWVIAHPSKPTPQPGKPAAVPGPYDISGSAHWANRADLGLTLHSPKSGTAELLVWKSRFRRFGIRGALAKLDFDALVGRYTSSVVDAMPDAPTEWDHQ